MRERETDRIIDRGREQQRKTRKRRERLEEEAEADKKSLHLDAQLHSTQPTLASTIFFCRTFPLFSNLLLPL